MIAYQKVLHFFTSSSVSKLLWGNGLANAIQFSSIILLSRLYAPEEFGMLAQMQSIALIGATVFTMQLHLSIPLSNGEREASDVAKMVETLCISYFGLAVAAGIFLPPIFAFSAALSLFVSLANTYSAFFLFKGDFSGISRFYVARACLIVAAQICFAAISIEDGLLWATLLGEGAATFYLRFQQKMLPLKRQTIWSGLKQLIVKSRAFSLYGTVLEIIAVAAFYAPLFLFDKYYGDAVSGQYAMANRLVWAPVALFSSSVAQVFYHKYAQKRPTGIGSYADGIPYMKIVIISVITCLLAWASQDLFVVMLGEQWMLASNILPMQVAWGAVFFLSTPFRVAIRVFGLQKWQLCTEAVFLASIAMVFCFNVQPPLHSMLMILIIAGLQNIILVAIVCVYHLRYGK